MLWTTSPAATEVEELALDWLAQLLGLPEGLHGHIDDTASTATIVALAAARELRPGGHVLTSEHANFSVEKAARLLGLECRFVPVDGDYRMRVDALASRSKALLRSSPQRARLRRPRSTRCARSPRSASRRAPGSTSTRPTRLRRGLRGARWTLDGAELADSIVINPHKWLFTPMDCSCFWTRRPEVVFRAFSAGPEYMPEREGRSPT